MSNDDVVRICAIESHYWGEVLDDKLSQIAIGAMGAAANICAAIMREVSPEQFEREVKSRNQAIADWATQRELEAGSTSPEGRSPGMPSDSGQSL